MRKKKLVMLVFPDCSLDELQKIARQLGDALPEDRDWDILLTSHEPKYFTKEALMDVIDKMTKVLLP